jgi:hypothetical protein
MAAVKFLYGNPLMVKHTPGSALAAGTVHEYAATGPMGVTHNAIAANALGNLSVGPGVYEVTCATASVTVGQLLYWDGTDKVTTTSTTNPPFGRALKATVGTNEKIPIMMAYQGGAILP